MRLIKNKENNIKKQKFAIKSLVLSFLLLISLISLSSVYADMGFHPEATFTVKIDGKPFENALVSVQDCGIDKRYENSDYSLAGLGTAQMVVSDNNLLANILQPGEDGKYLTKEEIEKYYQDEFKIKIPLDDTQLKYARDFILDEFVPLDQCFWQPSERAFTDCENITCIVTYTVPEFFRIKVVDLNSGKTYITNIIERKGLNTLFEVDFKKSGSKDHSIIYKEMSLYEPNAIGIFIVVFIINLVIELLAAIVPSYFIFKLKFKLKIKNIIKAVALGNLITHPIVYFIPQMLTFEFAILVLFILEIFVVVFEAHLICKIAKSKKWQGLIISFIINLFSFFIGVLVPFLGMRIV